MTSNLNIFLKFIVLSIIVAVQLIVATNAISAETKSGPPWYEIEVIIFLNQLELGVTSENWQIEGEPKSNTHPINLRRPGEIRDITTPDFGDPARNSNIAEAPQSMDDLALDQAFVLIDRGQLQLTKIFNKLNNSANYQPILHIAWRQPTLSPSKSLPVYVFNGMENPYSNPAPQQPNRDQFGQPAIFGSNSNTGNVYNIFEGPKVQSFSGTIRVSVSRYLHIETDLHYRSPVWMQETVEVVEDSSDSSITSFFGVQPTTTTNMVVEREVLTDFRLLETRRMRSTEIHYYDHPKFGVIVMATPYAVDTDS